MSNKAPIAEVSQKLNALRILRLKGPDKAIRMYPQLQSFIRSRERRNRFKQMVTQSFLVRQFIRVRRSIFGKLGVY